MKIEEFTPNIAYTIKIACQEYLNFGRAVKIYSEGLGYKREAWWQAAFRISTWVVFALPVALVWCGANYFAKNSIQERIAYWSREITPGNNFIKESRKQAYSEIRVREAFIQHLAHSGVPKKIGYGQIFFHASNGSESDLRSGNDCAFNDEEMPDQNVKALHIHFSNNEKNSKKLTNREYWGSIYIAQYEYSEPKADVVGMSTDQIQHLKFWGISNDLKEVLVSGKVHYPNEKYFLRNKPVQNP